MKLKPLNQNEFSMEIVKDLGMKPSRGSSNRNIRFAIFRCSACKKEFETIVSKAKSAKQSVCKSCSHKTHGLSNSNLYQRYMNMLNRCYNPKSNHYQAYGAKGVTVCKEWQESFESFADWCNANGYKKHLELDKDVRSAELGISPAIYSPETCSFISAEENSKHKQLVMQTNSSGYRGVTKHKRKYKATINVSGSFIHLGLWDTALEAAKAYDYYIVTNKLDRVLNDVLEINEKVDLGPKPRSNNKVGFIGVYIKGSKFAASCNIQKGKKKYLGAFSSPEEAAKYRETYIDNNNLQSINKRNK